MNCYKSLSVCFLFILSGSTYGQQVEFLKFVSDSVLHISETTSQVRLLFEIKNGLHIQSNDPESDTVIPTQIALEIPEEMVIGMLTFPLAKTLYLEGSDTPLQVFSGQLEILFRLNHPPLAKVWQLAGTLYYQACDEKRCFYPRELGFQVEFMP